MTGFENASGAWSDSALGLGSQQSRQRHLECYTKRHLTCTESPGSLIGSHTGEPAKRPGVLQVGHQADMQHGTGVVKPAKEACSLSHENK